MVVAFYIAYPKVSTRSMFGIELAATQFCLKCSFTCDATWWNFLEMLYESRSGKSSSSTIKEIKLGKIKEPQNWTGHLAEKNWA